MNQKTSGTRIFLHDRTWRGYARIMKIAIGCFLIVIFSLVEQSTACLRATVDERAVQWSTRIVTAKLSKIDAPVQLEGRVQEQRGNLGLLGTAQTLYFMRVYHFTVEKSLDGDAKPGESISVLRISSRTEEPQMNCAQHLTSAGLNHSFLLLLRPFSTFTKALPDVIKAPQDKSLQCIVHMEEVAALKSEEMTAIETTIASTRAGEAQFSPHPAERLLTKIANTKPETAGPSVRAFEKFGLKGLAALDAAIAREPVGSLSHTRLSTMKNEMVPPVTLLGQVQPEPAEEGGAGSRRR